MLTPEVLVGAILNYLSQPESSRKLTSEQLEWFRDPENVFGLLSVVLSVPDHIANEMSEGIYPWVDAAVNELATTMRKMPSPVKTEICAALEQVIEELDEEGVLCERIFMHTLTSLKRNQISLSLDVPALMAKDYGDNVAPLFAAEAPDFHDLLSSDSIETGFDFFELFEQGASLLPPEAYPSLFGAALQYSWGVDALLLMTQYFEEPVSLACAEQLDAMEPEKWKALTQPSLLTLCARFNRHPSISEFFTRWQKQVMKAGKASKPVKVKALYSTLVDGADCVNMIASINLNGEPCTLSFMFDFNVGVRESLLHVAPELSVSQFIKQVSNEVSFTQLSPDALASILPWVLSVNVQQGTPVDIASFYWISMLPPEWIAPQPFSLDFWCGALSFAPDAKRQEMHRKWGGPYDSMLGNWIAPEPVVSIAKEAKDLLRGYYYKEPVRFQARLTYCAAVAALSKKPDFRARDKYLDMACALDEKGLIRKTFDLFEWLATESFNDYQNYLADSLLEQLPPKMGLTIKVELEGARPKIWRRLQVSNQVTLHELDSILQAAMGWDFEHSSGFEQHGQWFDEEQSELLCVGHLLAEAGDSLNYVYDFGDNWQHKITLEKVSTKANKVPKVSAGNGGCPAEDCGGIEEWNHLLAIRTQSEIDEEDLEKLEWANLLPEDDLPAFDKVAANESLQALFSYE